MVNPVRIKTEIFPAFTPGSATSVTAATANYTGEVVNGEILEVAFKTNTTGSLFLMTSGTLSEVLWSSIAPSGTAAQFSYPLVYGVTNTNATGSPSMFTPRVVNSLVFLGGSGFEGGSITNFVVNYR